MKKLLAYALCACMVGSLLIGCGSANADTAAPAADTAGDSEASAETQATGDNVINVWAFTDEVPNMIQKYVDKIGRAHV